MKASFRHRIFMTRKKKKNYKLKHRSFSWTSENFIFETTDRNLTSYMEIPFRWETTQYHRIFRPLKVTPLLCLETSATGRQMTRRRTLHECKLQIQSCENLKTDRTFDVWDQYQKASDEFSFGWHALTFFEVHPLFQKLKTFHAKKNTDIWNYNFACCFVWMWNLVADIERGT